jgi:hypothetical protein
MTIQIGARVRETEIDPDWQMYPGEAGVVVDSGDAAMGVTPSAPDAGRFWIVAWSDKRMVHLDTEIEVVS